MSNVINKYKKKPNFMGIEIGNSFLVPLDRSLVNRLKINVVETVFEEELLEEGILLKIKALHSDSYVERNDKGAETNFGNNMNEND